MIKGIRSIYLRNFLTIAVILLVSFMLLGGAFSALSYRYMMREKRETMIANAEEAVHIVSAYSSKWNFGGLEVRMALSAISNTSGFHVMLCSASGVVVSCSDTQMNCPHIGKVVSAGTLGEMVGTQEYIKLTNIDGIYETPRYAMAMQIVYSLTGELAGFIILSADPQSMSGLWRDFSGIFLSIAVSVFAVAFIISIVTSKKQAQPLQEMATAACRFAKGDFSARVGAPYRMDEIGELSDAFNVMADSLERSENQRRELISNVSHELKTPMTTITGFAEGILDGTIPQDRQEHYLRIISSETRRMSRMVRSMLEVSQIQEMESERFNKSAFDIVELICLTLGSLEKRITDRKLDVSATLPEEPVYVCGDKDSITQVIYNLLDNAAKFSPEGHIIRVELWKQGKKAYIAIENDSVTIAQEELPLIFDRFHKADRSRGMDREGVGLGLYIVKTILDAHGESIFVTSESGVTKFVFTLSLKDE